MKKFLLICFGSLCMISGMAQNDVDAYRYSQLSIGGTARFISMGGSMGALGGDISTLGINPAGLPIFRKSELSISPTLFSQNTSSNYNNTNSSDKKMNFNLGHLGFVGAINIGGNSGWENINFGVGYNLINNFNNRINIQGDNKTSSILDTYVADANGHKPIDFYQFSTDLAWQTYLFNPNTNDSLHYHSVIKNYGEYQQKAVTSSGSKGETNISFGGNYKSKVYLGITIGIVRVKYVEESVYQETDKNDTLPDFKSLSFKQNLTTKGTGSNFKLGVIVKAAEWLRLGAAIHSPTSIPLTDTYSSSMNSDLDSGITYSASSPSGKFNYSVSTPLKVIGSAGFIFKQRGVINAEYEYIDYSSMQLHSNEFVFTDINNAIHSNYSSTSNFRIGAEIRADPVAFRAGFAFYGSPYKNGLNSNLYKTAYTAGIGFRENNYFIDLAYMFTMYTASDYLYDPTGLVLNSVENKYKSSNFTLTVGVKF